MVHTIVISDVSSLKTGESLTLALTGSADFFLGNASSMLGTMWSPLEKKNREDIISDIFRRDEWVSGIRERASQTLRGAEYFSFLEAFQGSSSFAFFVLLSSKNIFKIFLLFLKSIFSRHEFSNCVEKGLGEINSKLSSFERLSSFLTNLLIRSTSCSDLLSWQFQIIWNLEANPQLWNQGGFWDFNWKSCEVVTGSRLTSWWATLAPCN